MWEYCLAFLGSVIVSVLPVGPPAWTVMLFFQIQFHLNIWAALLVGVAGATLGKYLFILMIPKLSAKIIKPAKYEDLKFLGLKFGKKGIKSQLLILLYIALPLPKTELFMATSLARITPMHVLPPYFIAMFIVDAFLIHAGKYAADNYDNFVHEFMGWKTISGSILGLIFLAAFLFIDWHSLFLKKQFRLKFRIWE